MSGIEELPVTGLTRPTPGWTLIQERNYVDPSKAPLNPSSNARGKRSTRFDGGAQSKDALSLRQDTALRRRLDALHSENNKDRKDVAIVIPPKNGGSGTAGQKKTTPGVRKILQSERTFKHHLEEEEAFLKQQADAGKSATSLETGQLAATWAIPQSPSSKRKRKAVGEANLGEGTAATSEKEEDELNLLLRLDVPKLPSNDELLRLMTSPPLSYNAARVGPPPEDGPPRRHFCCICGFWGTVKCLICKERTCGLEHKEEHDATCNIYG